jgi:GcrA cell cycle regulator
MSGKLWTKERETRLRELHAQHLSPREIAARLRGTDRNAVIGKLHRMGLKVPRRQKPKQTTPQKSGPQIVRLKLRGRHGAFGAGLEVRDAPSLLPMMPDGSNVSTAQRRTLLQLNNSVCKWPFGEPQLRDFFFCGGDAVDGKPYCLEHCGLAYKARAA